MTFSLRLIADLVLARAARLFGNGRGLLPIVYLTSERNFDSAAAADSSNGAKSNGDSFQSVARVSRFRSPVVWIGGPEPLDHAQVARFSNALAASGRHVFVETSGASLKRRLHEFQPSARLHFVIRFAGRKRLASQSDAAEGEVRLGLEALRMARLAGFLTCGYLVVQPDTIANEIEALHAKIVALDVDGIAICSGADSSEVDRNVRLLRNRLLNRRWALLSSLIDASLLPPVARTPQDVERRPIPDSQPEGLGESVEAG